MICLHFKRLKCSLAKVTIKNSFLTSPVFFENSYFEVVEGESIVFILKKEKNRENLNISFGIYNNKTNDLSEDIKPNTGKLFFRNYEVKNLFF